jgi:hypothetical protein
MKTRQLELRAIPQFDSGRWKLRLERVSVDPDNENTMGMDFESAACDWAFSPNVQVTQFHCEMQYACRVC